MEAMSKKRCMWGVDWGVEGSAELQGPLLVYHLPITAVYIQIAWFLHPIALAYHENSPLVEKAFTNLEALQTSLFKFLLNSISSILPFWEGEGED